MKVVFKIIWLIFLLSPVLTRAQETKEDIEKSAADYFEDEKFDKAESLYLRLLSLEPRDHFFNYRYGACLVETAEDVKSSLRYLKYAVKADDIEAEAFYYLGKAYHLTYQFQKAIDQYTTYKSKAGNKAIRKLDVERQIETCNNGIGLLKSLTELIVLNRQSLPRENFFRIYDLSDIGGDLIVSSNFQSKQDKRNDHVPLIHFPSNSQTIFFSSYGDKGDNKNIYKSFRTNDGWTDPILLEGEVNTQYDEDFPYMHPSGKFLYFASKGHNSMGGYDIFRAPFDEKNNRFGKPENLDFPISSTDDDLLYLVDSLDRLAYFASERNSKSNMLNVYNVRVERFPQQIAVLRGEFISEVDPKSSRLTVEVKDAITSIKIGKFSTDNQGRYTMVLPKGGAYLFSFQVEGKNEKFDFEVNIPKLNELRPLKQIAREVYADEKEVITLDNRFDERFDDPFVILAEILEEQSKMKVNKNEFDLENLDKEREKNKGFEEFNLKASNLNELKEDLIELNEENTKRNEALNEELTLVKEAQEHINVEMTNSIDSINLYKQKLQEQSPNSEQLLSEIEQEINEIKRLSELKKEIKKVQLYYENELNQNNSLDEKLTVLQERLDSSASEADELAVIKSELVFLQEIENKEIVRDPKTELLGELNEQTKLIREREDRVSDLSKKIDELELRLDDVNKQLEEANKREIQDLEIEKERIQKEIEMFDNEVSFEKEKIAELEKLNFSSETVIEVAQERGPISRELNEEHQQMISDENQLQQFVIDTEGFIRQEKQTQEIDQTTPNASNEWSALSEQINETLSESNAPTNTGNATEDVMAQQSYLEELSALEKELESLSEQELTPEEQTEVEEQLDRLNTQIATTQSEINRLQEIENTAPTASNEWSALSEQISETLSKSNEPTNTGNTTEDVMAQQSYLEELTALERELESLSEQELTPEEQTEVEEQLERLRTQKATTQSEINRLQEIENTTPTASNEWSALNEQINETLAESNAPANTGNTTEDVMAQQSYLEELTALERELESLSEQELTPEEQTEVEDQLERLRTQIATTQSEINRLQEIENTTPTTSNEWSALNEQINETLAESNAPANTGNTTEDVMAQQSYLEELTALEKELESLSEQELTSEEQTEVEEQLERLRTQIATTQSEINRLQENENTTPTASNEWSALSEQINETLAESNAPTNTGNTTEDVMAQQSYLEELTALERELESLSEQELTPEEQTEVKEQLDRLNTQIATTRSEINRLQEIENTTPTASNEWSELSEQINETLSKSNAPKNTGNATEDVMAQQSYLEELTALEKELESLSEQELTPEEQTEVEEQLERLSTQIATTRSEINRLQEIENTTPTASNEWLELSEQINETLSKSNAPKNTGNATEDAMAQQSYLEELTALEKELESLSEQELTPEEKTEVEEQLERLSTQIATTQSEINRLQEIENTTPTASNEWSELNEQINETLAESNAPTNTVNATEDAMAQQSYLEELTALERELESLSKQELTPEEQTEVEEQLERLSTQIATTQSEINRIERIKEEQTTIEQNEVITEFLISEEISEEIKTQVQRESEELVQLSEEISSLEKELDQITDPKEIKRTNKEIDQKKNAFIQKEIEILNVISSDLQSTIESQSSTFDESSSSSLDAETELEWKAIKLKRLTDKIENSSNEAERKLFLEDLVELQEEVVNTQNKSIDDQEMESQLNEWLVNQNMDINQDEILRLSKDELNQKLAEKRAILIEIGDLQSEMEKEGSGENETQKATLKELSRKVQISIDDILQEIQERELEEEIQNYKGVQSEEVANNISFKEEVEITESEGYKDIFELRKSLDQLQSELKIKKVKRKETQDLILNEFNESKTKEEEDKIKKAIIEIGNLNSDIQQISDAIILKQKEIETAILNSPMDAGKLRNVVNRNSLPRDPQPEYEEPKVGIVLNNSSEEPLYTNDNPISLETKHPKGLVFRVQVGAFSKPVANEVFNDFSPVTGEYVNERLIRYMAGEFARREDANLARDAIRELGYFDAFVVAYCDGERLPVYKALQMLEAGTCVPSIDTTPNVIVSNEEFEELKKPVEISELDYNKAPGSAEADVAELIQGLYFTVQVGVYNRPVSAEQLKNISPLVTKRLPNGQLRYSSGTFRQLDLAKEKRVEAVGLGITDAFIVAYYKGERLTVAQANQLLNEFGDEILIPIPQEEIATKEVEVSVPVLTGQKKEVLLQSIQVYDSYPTQVMERYHESSTIQFYFDWDTGKIKSFLLSEERAENIGTLSNELQPVFYYKGYEIVNEDAIQLSDAVANIEEDLFCLKISGLESGLPHQSLDYLLNANVLKKWLVNEEEITWLAYFRDVNKLEEIRANLIRFGFTDMEVFSSKINQEKPDETNE